MGGGLEGGHGLGRDMEVDKAIAVGVYSHKQNISGSTGFSDTKRQRSRIHPKNWSEKGSVGFLKKPLSKDKATGKTVHEGHVFCVGHADLTTNA